MKGRRRKLVFLVTELGYFCSHRLNLAMKAKEARFEVFIITNCDSRPHLSQYEDKLNQLKLYHIPFHRSRLNPVSEVKILNQIWKAYSQIKPDIVHQVALKPVIYGTICARFLKVKKIVNALGGMGYLFTHLSLKSLIVRPIVSLAFRGLLNHPRCALILQNQDDLALMASFINRNRLHLVRGVGVNKEEFQPTPEYPSPLKAIMVSRLLWSKGVGEIVEAARLLRKEKLPLQIQIAGGLDPQNPASIAPEILQDWKDEGIITWLGVRTDIASLYAQAHIAVLPSYREGLPKTLLEAAACGKPIVTTDVPGCREVVIPGHNGFLVPPKNAILLAQALKKLALSPDLRLKMGQKSRQRIEKEFDEEKVIKQIMTIYVKD